MVEYDRLNATAPSDIVEEIKRIAEERRMSVSALVAEICTEYVEHIRSCVCTRCLMQVAPDARLLILPHSTTLWVMQTFVIPA